MMKRMVAKFFAGVLFLCAFHSGAQTHDAAQKADAGSEPTNLPPRHGNFHRGGGPQDGAYLDQWLERVKERDPAEFERMKKLRQDNPEEFKHELHQKLQNSRIGGLREHPQVTEAFKNLSPEDRDWVTQRLSGPPGEGGGEQHGGPSGWKHASPDFAAGEQKVHELAKKFHGATTDADKAAAKKEIRENIAKLFDVREKNRAADIKQLDEHLAKIRKQLDEHQSKRDEMIDARLKEVISESAVPAAP